ncbi:hypothetical protein [uncultured Pseudokineococcus sp.]|uniref:hypothetical protein n=1 Tax=uncultured Pseudokineococcus sp. TaxID=1642928 RepID=UPI002627ADA1|nr:hypothetical protein [uncultured Pseudokineococcus sp.]
MIVDCDGCAARGPACSDCVVGVLLGVPRVREGVAPAGRGPDAPGPVGELDDAERAALGVLASSGLVPPLRLVPVGPPGPAYDARRGGATRAG